MNVFGMACTPAGWLKLMNKDLSAYTLASMAVAFTSSTAYGFNNRKLQNVTGIDSYVKVPVSGNRVFAKWEYNWRYSNYTCTSWNGDRRKIICIYNSNGNILVSIGNAGDGASYIENVYVWNLDGTLKTTYPLPLDFNFYWWERSNWKTIAVCRDWYALEYYYDPNNPGDTRLNVIKNSKAVLSLDSTAFNTLEDISPKLFTYFEGGATYDDNLNIHSYLVVTDTVDLTIKPFPFFPNAFTLNDGFSGTVAAIAEKYQDLNYISSSATEGGFVEFNLASMAVYQVPNYSKANEAKIVHMAPFFYGRYVDGVAGEASFRLTLLTATDVELSSDVVTVPANENNNYFQTRLATFITTAGLMWPDIVSCKIRITLEAV